MAFDRLARHDVHKLLTEPVARLPVHLPERNPFGRADGRVKLDRTRNQR
jgi:hypothetical protein